MKIASMVFIVLVLLTTLKYTKVLDISLLVLVGIYFLWFMIFYIQIHLKNKDRKTPRPVYLTPQNE